MPSSDFPSRYATVHAPKALMVGGLLVTTGDDRNATGIEIKPGSSGAAAGTGVTAHEVASAARQVEIVLEDVEIEMVDEAGVVAFGGLKIYDLPQGQILFLGAVADLAMTKSSAGVTATWDGDFGLGTVTASNNGTLATTEQNFIPTTATPQAVAGVTTAKGASTSTEAAKVLDGSTALDVFLNFLVDDADHDVTTTPCNLIANGTIKFSYMLLGDN